jgi:hypothetical protein
MLERARQCPKTALTQEKGPDSCSPTIRAKMTQARGTESSTCRGNDKRSLDPASAKKTCSCLRKSNDSPVGVGQFAPDQI